MKRPYMRAVPVAHCRPQMRTRRTFVTGQEDVEEYGILDRDWISSVHHHVEVHVDQLGEATDGRLACRDPLFQC